MSDTEREETEVYYNVLYHNRLNVTWDQGKCESFTLGLSEIIVNVFCDQFVLLKVNHSQKGMDDNLSALQQTFSRKSKLHRGLQSD